MKVTNENLIEMMNRLYDRIADPDVFPLQFSHQLKVAKMRVEQTPEPTEIDNDLENSMMQQKDS